MRTPRLSGKGLWALMLLVEVLGGCASTQGLRSEWLTKIPPGCDTSRVEFVEKGGSRLLLLSVGGFEPAVAARWASGVREALLGSIAEKRQTRLWRKTLPKTMQMAVLGCVAASHDQAFWIGQLSGADAVLWGTLRERPKTNGPDAAAGPDSIDFHLTPVRPVARTSPFDTVVDFPPVIWWASWKEGAGEGSAPRTEADSSTGAEPAHPALAMNGGGIGPGPFDPRGQPVSCYVGTQVHDTIGNFYRLFHPLDNVRVNTSPIAQILRFADLPRPRGTPEEVLAARPDIVNLTRRHIYEIKPLGQSDAALIQMIRYQKYLRRVGLHMAPGPVGEPGTAGVLPAPKGHVFFYGAVPGVILYYCVEGRYEEVEETATDPRALAETAAAAKKTSSRRTVTKAPSDSPSAEPWWKQNELVAQVAALTGLTGTSLVVYLILSEGSRFVFWPRNALPVP